MVASNFAARIFMALARSAPGPAKAGALGACRHPAKTLRGSALRTAGSFAVQNGFLSFCRYVPHILRFLRGVRWAA